MLSNLISSSSAEEAVVTNKLVRTPGFPDFVQMAAGTF
jgi:hypothetical protein